MNSISYYSSIKSDSSDINRCSIESTEYPLIVNCAGNFRATFPFNTDNQSGRKDFYLLYVISGSMRVYLNGEAKEASAGNMVIFPPNQRYHYSYDGGEPLDYLWTHFTGSYAEDLIKECGLYPLPFFGYTANSHRISDKFSKIFEAFEAKRKLQRQELACLLEQVLISLAKAVGQGDEPRGLERSIRYIHSSYNKKISIPELAVMENLSNSRFITLFREQTGVSPSAYIIELRMTTACDLLQNTDLSVKQIGIMVGYNDAHFFSKLFKKHVGVSPKEFKNS